MKENIEFGLNLQKVSKKSKDRSTKVGVVIVTPDNTLLSIGFNGFPRGIDDEIERYHERPMKYRITEHAERNAIYNAARNGIRLQGSIMYLPFEPTPCTDCTRGIIQAGIVEVRGTNAKFPGKGTQWDEDLAIAKEMLDHAGIKRTALNC